MNDFDTNLSKLTPNSVWSYFEQICKIPRPSKKEDKIRQYLVDVANDLGLKYKVTDIGNVVIEKSATIGMEDCKKVTFQVHMDMVTAKLQSSSHNFDTDPIIAYIDGDWVTANGTTLGADNGMGMAYALAVMASQDIGHGPLELLITTDEEAGMTGAFGLNANDITGDILLNLDTEEDNEVCIGCAGGINTEITLPVTWANYDKNNKTALKVVLDGLYSGHSGVDIHLGRANAIKEIASFLYQLQQQIPFKLSHISGGRLRNVIPAYCEVVIVVDSKDIETINQFTEQFLLELKSEYQVTEKNLKLSIDSTELPNVVIEDTIGKKFILALHSCFNGLFQMNWDINIPQTSSNLGVVKIVGNEIQIITLQRSANDYAKRKLANRVGATFELIGANVVYNGEYAGWLPDLSSEILQIVKQCYEQLFNHKVKVSATHGGLECGIIMGKKPNIDAISIGATIRDPHSANERVNIESVNKIWGLIKQILLNIPKKSTII